MRMRDVAMMIVKSHDVGWCRVRKVHRRKKIGLECPRGLRVFAFPPCEAGVSRNFVRTSRNGSPQNLMHFGGVNCILGCREYTENKNTEERDQKKGLPCPSNRVKGSLDFESKGKL